ncbi:MAG: hypothetical protein JW770_03715 [Actinobacteria bacterium]|nr:hypothetical protein [Actinomycetota bacterium]
MDKKSRKGSLEHSGIIEENEKMAGILMGSGETVAAEKLLNKNIEMGTGSSLTYDMLLDIYKKDSDYHKIIKVLNNAIKYSDDSQKYRKLKKGLVTRKLMHDISMAEEKGKLK